MCGFFFCLSVDEITNKFVNIFNYSSNELKHRGRDSDNLIINENYCLRSFRNKIIDLSSKGDQPFEDVEQKYIICFNGIIYNNKELRTLLINRYNQKFKSYSDTETILNGYKVFKHEFFSMLEGQWSVLILNKKTNEVQISRDRFGTKPLYYSKLKNKILVSSEIKALKTILGSNVKVNLKRTNEYLKKGITDDDEHTFYEEIKTFKKNSIYSIRDNKINYHGKIWDFTKPQSTSISLNKLKPIIFDAIKKSTYSDVSIAVPLSCGIDSNSIMSSLKQMNLLNNLNVKCFSVEPPEAQEDLSALKKALKFYNCEYTYLKIKDNDLNYFDEIDNLLKIQDEPLFNSSYLYQLMLRKTIHQDNIKVVLTGDGADEIFGGYKKVYYSYLASAFKVCTKKEFIKILKSSNSLMDCTPFDLIKDIKKYFYNGINKRNVQSNMSGYKLLKNEYDIEIDHRTDYEYENIKSFEDAYHFFFELMERFRLDITHHLRCEDRISSYYHICSRPSFLNHNLIEQVWQVNFLEFMKNGSNKNILRKVLSNVLPKEIQSIKKKYVRPGNNAHLVYKILHDKILKMIVNKNRKNIFNEYLKNSFLLDAKNYNFHNSYTWLRYYLYQRWLYINDLSANNL